MSEFDKIIVIPGWMSSTRGHDKYRALNVWSRELKLDYKIEAEYVAGYSMGANFAIWNWQFNKDNKLILINPALPKRSVVVWLFRWLKFFRREGLDSLGSEVVSVHKHIIYGLVKCWALFKKDLMGIIAEMPNDKLVMIRGKDDKFFCDEEARNMLRGLGVKVIEVERAGHNLNK